MSAPSDVLYSVHEISQGIRKVYGGVGFWEATVNKWFADRPDVIQFPWGTAKKPHYKIPDGVMQEVLVKVNLGKAVDVIRAAHAERAGKRSETARAQAIGKTRSKPQPPPEEPVKRRRSPGRASTSTRKTTKGKARQRAVA